MPGNVLISEWSVHSGYFFLAGDCRSELFLKSKAKILFIPKKKTNEILVIPE